MRAAVRDARGHGGEPVTRGRYPALLWGLPLVLPLAGCAAEAQDAYANGVAVMMNGADIGNFTADLGPALTVDDKLKAMGPDGWHRIALYANWDFTEDAVWQWMVSQPDCDRATALEIFWKASPDYYLQYRDRSAVPAGERAHYDLIISIRDRWVAGGYKRSELAADPLDIQLIDFAGLEKRYGDRVAKLMPLSMRVRVRGRVIENAGDPLPGTLGPEPEYSGNSM
jgi:hypothetical protein